MTICDCVNVSDFEYLSEIAEFNVYQFIQKQLEDKIGLGKYLRDEEILDLSPIKRFRLTNEMRNYELFAKLLEFNPTKPRFMVYRATENDRENLTTDHVDFPGTLSKVLKPQKVEQKKQQSNDFTQSSKQHNIMVPQPRRVQVNMIQPNPKSNVRAANIVIPPTEETITKEESTTSNEAKTIVDVTTATSRYPRRAKAGKRYSLFDVHLDDKFIYCEACNFDYQGDCPTHGPLKITLDNQVRKNRPGRSLETLPSFLYLEQSTIRLAGLGVYTNVHIDSRTRFGPYDGDFVTRYEEAYESGYSWQVSDVNNDKKFHFVDAGNEANSNWMRYVNCARNDQEQNLHAYQDCGQIYYITYKSIEPHTELMVYYGNGYAKELGINRLEKNTGTTSVVSTLEALAGEIINTPKQDSHVAEESAKQNNLVVTEQSPSSGTTSVATTLEAFAGEFINTLKQDSHVAEESAKQNNLVVTEQSPSSGNTDFDTDLVGVKLHQCMECQYSTKRYDHFKRHIRVTHTSGNRSESHEFSTCFTAKSNSKQRHVTGSSKSHMCGYCSRFLVSKTSLKEHIRIHTNEKPHVCKYCGRCFRQSSSLAVHTRTHTGQKDHKCGDCGKMFAKKANLTQHMRIHSGVKPYQCSVCQRSFSQSQNLQSHMFTHGDFKPRHCTRCDYSCITSCNMKKHIKRHHNEE